MSEGQYGNDIANNNGSAEDPMDANLSQLVAQAANLSNLAYIIAVPAGGQQPTVVPASGWRGNGGGSNPCNPAKQFDMQAGGCGGGVAITCKYVTIGTTMYWVCA